MYYLDYLEPMQRNRTKRIRELRLSQSQMAGEYLLLVVYSTEEIYEHRRDWTHEMSSCGLCISNRIETYQSAL